MLAGGSGVSVLQGLVLGGLLVVLIGGLVGGRWLDRRIRAGRSLRGSVVIGVGVLLAANVAGASHHLGDGGWSRVAQAGGLVALAAVAVTLGLLRIGAAHVDQPRRVLAIGAHPDDLELACGGTLAKLADGGHEVHAVVLSAGEIGGDASTRPGQARRAARFMGLSSVQVHEFADTRLAEQSQDLVTAIERAIGTVDPDLILTHSGNDQHQDHLAVHLATLRAARHHPSILCFESPSVTKEFTPSFFVDISSYVEVKVAAVRAHRDQLGKPYMTAERVRGAASFRGAQARRRYAEGFEPVRVLASVAGEL